MRRSELEKTISHIKNFVYKNYILDGAIYLASHGTHVYDHDSGSNWGGFLYEFKTGELLIEYEEYAMWDKRVEISYNNETVFEAKDAVSYTPNVNVEVKTHGKFSKTFTILKFSEGPWLSILKDNYTDRKKMVSKFADAARAKKKKSVAKLEKRDPTIPSYIENELIERFK